MRRNYKKLIEELNNKNGKSGYQSSFGPIIREERMKRNLTQSEVAKGICSISYLSKIENGLYDNKNLYVQEIVRRLNLEINRYHTFDYSKVILKAVKYLYQGDIEGLQKLRSQFDRPVVPAEWLVELAVSIHQSKEALEAIEILDINRKALSKVELHAYLILYCMHELAAYRPTTLEPTLESIVMLESDNIEFNVLSNWVHARYYILIGKYTIAGFYLSQIIANYGPMLVDHWRMDVLANQLLIFAMTKETQIGPILMAQADQISGQSEWYTFACAFYYMQMMDYTQAIQLFLQAKDIHFGPSILGIIECSFQMKNAEILQEYYNILYEKAPGSFYEKLGYMFVLALESKLEKVKNYITHIIQPMFQTYSHDYYHGMSIMFITAYFRSVSRYKQVDLLRVKR